MANADVFHVFNGGNVRVRCYQIFNITCRDKQNPILRLRTSRSPCVQGAGGAAPPLHCHRGARGLFRQ